MNQVSSPARIVRKIGVRSHRGQATIEFALVIIMLILMVVSILEIILFMHTYNVLADSAKEGVRYAIVHGAKNPQGITPPCTSATCPDLMGPPAPPGTIPGYNSSYGIVKTFAQYSLHDTSGMTVTVTYPGGDAMPVNRTPNRVQVVVSYPYKWFFGLGWSTITVNAAAEGRIMR